MLVAFDFGAAGCLAVLLNCAAQDAHSDDKNILQEYTEPENESTYNNNREGRPKFTCLEFTPCCLLEQVGTVARWETFQNLLSYWCYSAVLAAAVPCAALPELACRQQQRCLATASYLTLKSLSWQRQCYFAISSHVWPFDCSTAPIACVLCCSRDAAPSLWCECSAAPRTLPRFIILRRRILCSDTYPPPVEAVDGDIRYFNCRLNPCVQRLAVAP